MKNSPGAKVHNKMWEEVTPRNDLENNAVRPLQEYFVKVNVKTGWAAEDKMIYFLNN